jgi:hypothetical protein
MAFCICCSVIKSEKKKNSVIASAEYAFI